MHNYTNNCINQLATTVIVIALFMIPATAVAQGLSVDFNPDPLFTADNFLPGDTKIGEVTVTNTSEQVQSVQTSAAEITNADALGDQLDITILEADNELYAGTLSNFFADEVVTLSDLAAGDSANYTFNISFRESAGNDYQNKSLGFDLCVGFAGGNITCEDTEDESPAEDDASDSSQSGSRAGGSPGATLSSDSPAPDDEDGGVNQEVAGAATTTTDSSNNMPQLLAEMQTQLREMLAVVRAPNTTSESSAVAGTSTTSAQSPGLPNTGTGGYSIKLAGILLLLSAIVLLAGRLIYQLFGSTR